MGSQSGPKENNYSTQPSPPPWPHLLKRARETLAFLDMTSGGNQE